MADGLGQFALIEQDLGQVGQRFRIIRAVLQGGEGIKTLSGLTEQSVSTAVVITVAAALTGTVMTYLKIPISTSQAVVGAILGVGLAMGQREFTGLVKVVVCWVGTPIGAMLVAGVVYKLLGAVIRYVPMSVFTRDKLLWAGLLAAGTYGSYALGANNVTNATGIFSGLIDGISDRQLAALGGLAIALGVITYSRRVIYRVGTEVMPLDAFTALVAVLGMSVTVHLFAVIGVPVSTSQGIVGSILGIGMLRGVHAIHVRVLYQIGLGWVLTPAVSLILAAAGYAIFCGP